mmetsp:Transcript_57525/g.95273  ORF Transcript_57525/g.95273 Transcript_57525/m.95273 type:complete len:246 (-) Transcript_57525:33-770(-)
MGPLSCIHLNKGKNKAPPKRSVTSSSFASATGMPDPSSPRRALKNSVTHVGLAKDLPAPSDFSGALSPPEESSGRAFVTWYTARRPVTAASAMRSPSRCRRSKAAQRQATAASGAAKAQSQRDDGPDAAGVAGARPSVGPDAEATAWGCAGRGWGVARGGCPMGLAIVGAGAAAAVVEVAGAVRPAWPKAATSGAPNRPIVSRSTAPPAASRAATRHRCWALGVASGASGMAMAWYGVVLSTGGA